MQYLYNLEPVIRSQKDWESILENFLEEFAEFLNINYQISGHFIEKQSKGEASYGCHVDFFFDIHARLNLVGCGILCFSANWYECVSIGSYILTYQNGIRQIPQEGSPDSVFYTPRTKFGWDEPFIEVGELGEWTQYNTPSRWF